MATTKKKAVKKTKAKSSRSAAKKSQSKQAQIIDQLRRERDEGLQQLAAASHILRVIASSPTDIQPVLDGVAENAGRLCAADDAQILRIEGDVLTRAASYGSHQTAETRPITREIAAGRAVIDRQTVHVHDIRAAEGEGFRHGAAFGYGESRTLLAVPLLRESIAIGVILIRRFQVRPFSDNQIALLKTFADQAVIAIENARLFQELKESLEQQTATSEILGVIASSPTDIQPVLDAVAENAARLCDAVDAVIFRRDGDYSQVVAAFGSMPIASPGRNPISRGTPADRAMHTVQTVHVHDLAAEVDSEFPDAGGIQNITGTRTALATPLLREGIAIGAILIRRMEVRPFSEKQIALLKTFADQAVIAIENVRLFKEIQERNAELREALEHQTATSEVLGIISRSPTDVQPVLDAIVESATRVCGIDDVTLRLREGENMVARAHFGPIPLGRGEISIDEPQYRWMREHGALHIPDVRAQNKFPGIGSVGNFRTYLAAPLRQQGELIGGLFARRTEVRPFTPPQIALLKTFADQAVIAIENVRLFQELQVRNRDLTEALEQQTATSDILAVISSAPTELQPVFDTIAEHSVKLCGALFGSVYRFDGELIHMVADNNYPPAALERSRQLFPTRPDRHLFTARAILDRAVIHVPDVENDPEHPASEIASFRSVLSVPMLRGSDPIGVITVWHADIGPFSQKQVALLQTFADQAVIAIENVRLFNEIQERNAELREALEHQTATAEVLGIISRSPTDVQPVLDAIVESAARVCGIDDVLLRLREGNNTVPRAHFGPIPIGRGEISIDEPHYRWVREHGTLHIPDVHAQNKFPGIGSVGNFRTYLAAPLRQQGELIGSLNARRMEVRPFSPAQIKLLETFADQAVIAIENVRLFRELKEALEQQTATSEILGVIASSPTDIQPVLDVVAENAARLCDATDAVIHRNYGDKLRSVANYGSLPTRRGGEGQGLTSLDRDSIPGRTLIDRRTLHIHDLAAEPEDDLAALFARSLGVRTVLSTPLMREGIPIGTIHIRRMEVRPFSDKQVKLLETFADQAVIAIENVRLFQELESRTRELARSVGELKALGDVGQAVSSTLDLQTVLSTIVGHAVQLSGTDGGVIYEYDEGREEFELRASHRMEEEVFEALKATPIRLGQGATGQAATIQAPVQVAEHSRGTRIYCHTRSPHSCTAGLSIRSGRSPSPRRKDHGCLDGLAEGDGQLFGGGCQPSSDLRYSIRTRNPERAAVP